MPGSTTVTAIKDDHSEIPPDEICDHGHSLGIPLTVTIDLVVDGNRMGTTAVSVSLC